MSGTTDATFRPTVRGPWYRPFDDWYYATIWGQPVRLAQGVANVESARAKLAELTNNL
jgi:hypothetical protein